MRKIFTATFLLFAFHLVALAQQEPIGMPSTPGSQIKLLTDLKGATVDSTRLNLLVKLASYYLYKDGEFKSDLDSADLFLNRAGTLSVKLNNSKIRGKLTFLKAQIAYERHDYRQARIFYLQAVDYYKRSGEKAKEARVWIEIWYSARYASDTTKLAGLKPFEHAMSIYKELGYKQKEADAIKELGDELLSKGKYEESEKVLLKALSIYQSIGYKKLHFTYDLLRSENENRGNYDKALFYALKTVQSVEATGDTSSDTFYYMNLAYIYRLLGEHEKNIYWLKRAAASAIKRPNDLYFIKCTLFDLLMREHREKEAGKTILSIPKTGPPISLYNKESIFYRLGNYYSWLGNDKLTEKNYLLAIQVGEEFHDKLNLCYIYWHLGEHFFTHKRYMQARIYLQKALKTAPGGVTIEVLINSYLDLFKTDSLTGNYISAIKNYQRYKFLNDSVKSVAKAKQIAQIQLQYEKDQKVQQLENKGKLQQVELQHAGIVRNFIVVGATLLLVSLVLGYWRYRQKQHSNRLLIAQQNEINQINQSLELTVAEKETLLNEKEIILTEKDSLLIEKDWLLKEIHHRVKNNLHTIISLLETQASYLEDDALKAMESSRNRIFSMSLIHQKLYQSEEVKVTDMSVYLPEFVSYLRDSFDVDNYIHFALDVDPVQLSVSQAVPLALVLNEAITNAMKHAFPGRDQGQIIIKMKQTGEYVELMIMDNGAGMAKVMDKTQRDTLGLNLMKGLIKEIRGQINFENNHGTIITITFKIDHWLKVAHFELS